MNNFDIPISIKREILIKFIKFYYSDCQIQLSDAYYQNKIELFASNEISEKDYLNIHIEEPLWDMRFHCNEIKPFIIKERFEQT